MPATILQVNSGVNNAPGSATQAATLPAGATAGSQVLIVVGADEYRTTGGVPSGATEHVGCNQQTFLGHYLWRRPSVGGETSFSYTLGSAAPAAWIAVEVGGIDSTTPYDISAGQLAQSSGDSYTTPAITPTAGERLLVATIGAAYNGAFTTGMSNWLNSFTEQADVFTVLASGTRDNVGLAILSVTADGLTAYSSGASYDGVTPQARTGIIMSLRVAGAAPAAVSAPLQSPYRRRLPLLVR